MAVRTVPLEVILSTSNGTRHLCTHQVQLRKRRKQMRFRNRPVKFVPEKCRTSKSHLFSRPSDRRRPLLEKPVGTTGSRPGRTSVNTSAAI
eukprot:3088684-Rhodomonas_salina.1